ncbi:MAG TPA: hypothetical protein VNU95_12515 [Candidatus Acidoferrales bacterium]|jgi:hypothetical protein|nr:hypothetical protein [Candidatus Acidoferrales bacterium]
MSRDQDEVEFNGFLKDLVKAGNLEGAAEGITKLVIAEGRDKLTEKQDWVFQTQVIDKFVHERCGMCHQKIPWCEMFFAIDKGFCAACDPDLRP